MPFLRPDVLVLAAGGVVGEAWMTGVLRGISDEAGTDFRTLDAYVGTSAGSIVAASLAAGREPRAPDGVASHQAEPATRRRSALRGAESAAAALTVPFANAMLAAGAPGGALARRAVLGRLPRGKRSLRALRTEVASWGVRFDGRLRICTVELESGRRVVFGAPGAPPADVGEAVEASCAVPTVFRPVTIGGRTHVDGGAWSLTNLDVAPVGRDTQVLCLTVGGGPLSAIARPAAALEAAALRRRGARVRIVAPDAPLGGNLLDPRHAAPALDAGYRQGRRIATE